MAVPTPRPAQPGRRPGSAVTRDRILQAARNQFASKGFEHATIRSIAGEAGVDSALVHHYFGTKKKLLVNAIALPVDPTTVLDTLADVPVDQLGEVLARTVVTVWDSAHRPAVIAAVRSALTGGQEGLIRSFLLEVALRDIEPRVDSPRGSGALRIAMVASQMTGLFVARHLLGVAVLADLSTEQTVRLVGPTLQRYLTGTLD